MERMATITGKRQAYTVSRETTETRPAGIDRPAPERRDEEQVHSESFGRWVEDRVRPYSGHAAPVPRADRD